MATFSSPFPTRSSRLGFHYFPDTLHYQEKDLQTWLPRIKELGASWLMLPAILNRAIPEYFINGLLQAGIEPVLQFRLPLVGSAEGPEMQTLLSAYARWGVRGVIFFDQPNARTSWPSSGWAQQDLVERYLDRFLPLSDMALQVGMVPVFSPLEPGGSYWDTAFLRSALESLERRKQNLLLDNLVLSANVWTHQHDLEWGVGGPDRWPEARPYFTPAGEQDQRGFRIYDWYQAVSQAVLQKDCPILLLNAGVPNNPLSAQRQSLPTEQHAQTCLAIARLLAGEKVPAEQTAAPEFLHPIPSTVLACSFWLLSATPGSPFATQAWLHGESGLRSAAAAALKGWRSQPASKAVPQPKLAADPQLEIELEPDPGLEMPLEPEAEPQPESQPEVQPTQSAPEAQTAATPTPAAPAHPLNHYLLLPVYEWGVADWHLQVIQPFVKKYRPTVGFSLEEAALATRVTVIGNEISFSEERINFLRQSGCLVERISGDGTKIATELAER